MSINNATVFVSGDMDFLPDLKEGLEDVSKETGIDYEFISDSAVADIRVKLHPNPKKLKFTSSLRYMQLLGKDPKDFPKSKMHEEIR